MDILRKIYITRSVLEISIYSTSFSDHLINYLLSSPPNFHAYSLILHPHSFSRHTLSQNCFSFSLFLLPSNDDFKTFWTILCTSFFMRSNHPTCPGPSTSTIVTPHITQPLPSLFFPLHQLHTRMFTLLYSHTCSSLSILSSVAQFQFVWKRYYSQHYCIIYSLIFKNIFFSLTLNTPGALIPTPLRLFLALVYPRFSPTLLLFLLQPHGNRVSFLLPHCDSPLLAFKLQTLLCSP